MYKFLCGFLLWMPLSIALAKEPVHYVLFKFPESKWVEVREFDNIQKISPGHDSKHDDYKIRLKFNGKYENVIITSYTPEDRKFFKEFEAELKKGKFLDLTYLKVESMSVVESMGQIIETRYFSLPVHGYYTDFEAYASYLPSFEQMFGRYTIGTANLFTMIHKRNIDIKTILDEDHLLRITAYHQPQSCLTALSNLIFKKASPFLQDLPLYLQYDSKLLGTTQINPKDRHGMISGMMEIFTVGRKIGQMTIASSYTVATPAKEKTIPKYNCELVHTTTD